MSGRRVWRADERPWLLDLFSGAGGAGEGYRRAGFHVVGVDIAPQPRNPHEFYQGDALAVLDTLLAGDTWQGYRLNDFDAIHASPPCQFTTRARHIQRRTHPDLLTPTRARLQGVGSIPWVIENVSEAPMPHFLLLCGTHFGLRVYRHRQFESSEILFAPGPCRHPSALLPGFVCIVGGKAKGRQTGNHGNHFVRMTPDEARHAMQIEWMTLKELCQAIPPAYTQWLGTQLISILAAQAA